MPSYPENFGELSYNEENKTHFLKKTRALLRAVAKRLTEEGVIEASTVSVNKAGIAVGGDAYAYFYAPGMTYGILMTITHSGFSRERPDGVVCYGQYRRTYPGRCDTLRGTRLPVIGQIVGDNVHVRNNLSEDSVCEVARRMLKSHPESSAAA